jgi:hypothetical protein
MVSQSAASIVSGRYFNGEKWETLLNRDDCLKHIFCLRNQNLFCLRNTTKEWEISPFLPLFTTSTFNRANPFPYAAATALVFLSAKSADLEFSASLQGVKIWCCLRFPNFVCYSKIVFDKIFKLSAGISLVLSCLFRLLLFSFVCALLLLTGCSQFTYR